MVLHGRIMLIIILAAATTTAAAQALPPQAKSGCPTHCGNLTIPYPFGMDEGCYLNDTFFINCTADGSAYLMKGNLRVTNISLDEGELQIQHYVAKDCYNSSGKQDDESNVPELWLAPPYTISSAKNKLFTVGCDTKVFIEGYRGKHRLITGCISFCDSDSYESLNDQIQDSCSGAGCCQTSIPKGLQNGTINLSSYYNHTYVLEFNPCSYSFITEETQFSFSNESFKRLEKIKILPLVLNWAIGDDPDGPADPCDATNKKEDYACKANSKCVKSADRNGYICQCLLGFEGNPYLPDGCQDIDECKIDPKSCKIGMCKNEPGNYSCICPKGYKNDANGTSCIKDNSNNQSKTILLIISLGVSVGFLVLLVGISSIYWGMKKRKFMKLKEKYFKENGGLLLKQQLASRGGSVETTKIFAAEELEKATNNYHESRVLGEGGYGTVYKGILPDNKVVAIKKSKIGAPTQNDQFVNEVILLSQVNHRNVVRLLGCCLETEVPLLVYEFITHGTLFEHVHNKKGKGSSSLSWELRLKIASETAGALAYLHSSISIPIIHRDVKLTNILLDENFTAKVSDFGASRLIPADQKELSTLVQGTLGYLDPEYLQSNTLTEKSDVYSFGVVLVELLTSKVALSFDRPEAERNLASFFVRSMEDDHLIQILDEDILNEGNIETIEQVASLAKRCLRVKGEERPGMKEVAMELEGIRITTNHPWRGQANFCGEEAEYLLGSSNSEACVVNVGGDGSSSGTTRGYDSMQIQQLMPYDDGR